MNVSTPASVPDLAALLLLMGTPSETKALISGSAPTPSPKAGAETPQSFGSALAEILASAEEPGNEPDGQESKTLITGVAATLPQTVVPTAPLQFDFALPSEPVALKPEPADFAAGLETVAGHSQKASPAIARAIPSFETALPLTTPQLAADTPELESDAPQPPAADTELPHTAFAERFIPAPAEAPASGHSPTPIRIGAPATPKPLPKADGGALESANAEEAPAASVQSEKPVPPGRAPEQHQDDARDSRDDPRQPQSEPALRSNFQTEPIAPAFASPRPAPASGPAPHAPAPPPSNLDRAVTEPVQPQQHAPIAHTADAHTISLRVTDTADQKVDLRISDHAGEVKVAVRASDPDLAGTLRENLGELVHKLEQSGLRADNWHAPSTDGQAQIRQTNHAEGESLSRDHSGRQQQNQGDGRDRRQQDRQQHPAWMEELETSFKPDSERSSNAWLRA